LVATGALIVVVGVALVALWTGSGDDDEGTPGSAGGGTTTTSMVTGGIEVDVPDGWQPVPLPQLGFGLAIPGGWEAVVLSDETLADLAGADPVVPGFLEAAHAARQNGAVFYAAGVDGQGRVVDLKVRAAPGTGVTDVAGLEAYARQLATEAGQADADVSVVESAAVPTVDVHYETTAQRTPEDGAQPVDVTVRGTDRLVLSPAGVVYSLIVTSEDAPDHDQLAAQLVGSLAFPPE
jgi:hypothetical protein